MRINISEQGGLVRAGFINKLLDKYNAALHLHVGLYTNCSLLWRRPGLSDKMFGI